MTIDAAERLHNSVLEGANRLQIENVDLRDELEKARAERDTAHALLQAITQYHDYQSIIDEPERARIAQLLGGA